MKYNYENNFKFETIQLHAGQEYIRRSVDE